MHVYMMVTEDEYELPVAIADTPKELADIVGTNRNAILAAISHMKSGRRSFSRYRKVEWDDEEGEDTL